MIKYHILDLHDVRLHYAEAQGSGPALVGTLMGHEEPDELLSQIRCPVHLLVAQYKLGGAMHARDVQRAVALGDLDGDGDVDAMVGNGRGAVVWINQGRAQGGRAGTFVLSRRALAGGEARSVFLSDLDGDGDLEALTGGVRQATI